MPVHHDRYTCDRTKPIPIDTFLYRDKSRLRCRYNFGFHPFMKIAPIKEEEVYPKPKLVIYYDVISEEEMRVVKDFASPRVTLIDHPRVNVMNKF